ncbi:MAG: hypothetical protein AAGG44_00785 [Planctomycetota bacterium]
MADSLPRNRGDRHRPASTAFASPLRYSSFLYRKVAYMSFSLRSIDRLRARRKAAVTIGLSLLVAAMAAGPMLAGAEPVAQDSGPDSETAEAQDSPKTKSAESVAGASGWVRRIMPESSVIYAEIPEVPGLINKVLEHPLREKLEAVPAFQEFKNSPQYAQFRGGLAIFQAGMGMRWPSVVERLTANGTYFCLDAESEGVALMLGTDGPEVIQKLLDVSLSLARQGKLAGSENDPVKEAEYAGYRVFALGDDLFLADLEDWILVTNKKDLGRNLLDRMVATDVPQSSLGASERFREALAARNSDGESSAKSDAWLFLDAKQLRDAGVAEELYGGRSENILAEMLFGGIVGNLEQTPYLSVSAELTPDQLGVQVESPNREDAIRRRASFFGEQASGQAPDAASIQDALLSIDAYRDLAGMWLYADDLLQERALEELAQADSQLSTFFSGKDFGEDILGALGPEVQIVAANQVFPDGTPTPAIKLPAFALRFDLLNAKETVPDFRRVFHSLIGFLNVVGAMEGQPQLDFAWDREEGIEILSASYVPNLQPDEVEAAPIQFNFSPTVVFEGEQFIVSSSRALAEQIATNSPSRIHGNEYGAQQDASQQPSEGSASATNTLVKLDGQQLHRILKANQQQLVTQNMLEDGNSREEAELEIGLLLDAASWFASAELTLECTPESSNLRLELTRQK